MAFGPALADRRGAFERIDRDVHRRPPAPTRSPMIQHRRFVHLAFADDHGAVDRHRVERLAHRFNGGAVGLVLVAMADPVGRGDGRGLGDPDEFQGEVTVGLADGERLCSVMGFLLDLRRIRVGVGVARSGPAARG